LALGRNGEISCMCSLQRYLFRWRFIFGDRSSNNGDPYYALNLVWGACEAMIRGYYREKEKKRVKVI
jgi:hypothetical protein